MNVDAIITIIVIVAVVSFAWGFLSEAWKDLRP
jgi:hypothetical protein